MTTYQTAEGTTVRETDSTSEVFVLYTCKGRYNHKHPKVAERVRYTVRDWSRVEYVNDHIGARKSRRVWWTMPDGDVVERRSIPERPCESCTAALSERFGGATFDLRADVLKGTFNERKPCGKLCMGATGPSCDCYCGGRNHGGAYDKYMEVISVSTGSN